MANGSGIEWTEATWNPSTGCSKISPGCANCYAEKLSKRLQAMNITKYQLGFQYVEHEKELDLPLTWKKPRKVFVNSMSDLFHEKATYEFTKKCFYTMIKANHHTYQVLTKRPGRMAKFSYRFSQEFKQEIPNFIWMGTSVEDGSHAERIDELRRVNCVTRFISFEPLLGEIKNVNLENMDWAIIGGESGAGYREVRPEWVSSLIRQCKKQRVPVFFKQWGGIRPKSNGRELNGKIFDEYPKIRSNKHVRNSIKKLVEKVQAAESQEKQKPVQIAKIPLRNQNSFRFTRTKTVQS